MSSRRFFLPALLALVLLLPLYGQTEERIDMDAVSAEEAFMSGVRAYHDGEFGSAILSFERSLAFKPGNNNTRLWLGNSYYRSGLLNSAMEQWIGVMNSEAATASLKNRIDSFEYRRSMGPELSPESRFVEVDRLDGSSEEYTIFLGPTSVVPREDGGSFIVSFASNEVVSVSINGMIKGRIRGGVQGLNRPFDALAGPDGRLYVSEYQGDRIVSSRPDGSDIKRFGGKGRGEGELLGPQYMTLDEEGYLYVTEQGNRRVSKFNRNGDFILSFGKRSEDFTGFRKPTGICVIEEVVYVADGRSNTLYRFDPSGNYLGSSGEGLFDAPEGLTAVLDNKIIVADGKGLTLYDPARETTRLLVESRGESNFLKGDFDANGNIVIADFAENALYRYADFHQLYGSLLVEVERVMEERFPEIAVEVSVSTRRGTPVIGMEANNFLVTEGRVEAGGFRLAGSIDELESAAVAVVVERSASAREYTDAFGEGISALVSSAEGRADFSFVGAGELPVREVRSTYTADSLIEALLQGSAAAENREWKTDSSIRLAASGLTAANKKRAIVFFSSGDLPLSAFARHELVEIARYLEANHISFYCVLPFAEGGPEEFRYLAEKSGGSVIHLFRPEGIGPLAQELLERRDGRYILEYTSSIDDDFGRSYLPVEVQAYLHGRSGRGETGYFAPLR